MILPMAGRLALAAIGLAAMAPDPATAAVLSGTVTIKEKGGSPGDPSRSIVWIEGAEDAAPPMRAEIRMRAKTFEPPVVALPAGSTVGFPNADPILHNVFSVSGENRFDLGLYGPGTSREAMLRSPGVVRIYCNVHPQMEAFVIVTPGRWAGRVARDGSFAILQAPAGRYAVHVWDERGGTASQTVEVSPDGRVIVDFVLDASSYRRRPHLDKNGLPYRTGSREPY